MSVPRGTLQRIMLASRPGDDNISRCGIVIILCSQNDPKIKLCAGNYWLTKTYVSPKMHTCEKKRLPLFKKQYKSKFVMQTSLYVCLLKKWGKTKIIYREQTTSSIFWRQATANLSGVKQMDMGCQGCKAIVTCIHQYGL